MDIWRWMIARGRVCLLMVLTSALPWSLPWTVDVTLAQGVKVEIQIRDTPEGTDDYLTWAPARARIRVASAPVGTPDLTVFFSSATPGSLPEGCDPAKAGRVVFAERVDPGKTAEAETLQLVVPATGAWKTFVVAGKFGSPSSCDKDTVIAVHLGSQSAPAVHTHPVMVRIRKDARRLTERERRRFLLALGDVHATEPEYVRFVTIHDVGANGKMNQPPAYYWPDVAHRGSGFLPWHRVFLLSLERRLQAKYPDVALPYWVVPETSNVFQPAFLGGNRVGGDLTVPVDFESGNPLGGWSIGGVTLTRYGKDRTQLGGFTAEETSVNQFASYHEFRVTLERNPHNNGHNWVGPWMNNCMISPRDPLFWVFHTYFDRVWAKWQHVHGRFISDGSRPADYAPADSYDPKATGCDQFAANSCVPIGHHGRDTMWPWNETVGPGINFKGNWPPTAASAGLTGKFPPSGIVGIWPQAPASPTPLDTIDYAGMSAGRVDMGFAYDDVPYGTKSPAVAPPQPALIAKFLDRHLPATDRLAVAAHATATPAETADLRRLISDKAARDEIRAGALRLLGQTDEDAQITHALAILADGADGGADLDAVAVEVLASHLNFTNAGQLRHAEIVQGLAAALTDARRPVRVAAAQTLAAHGAPEVVRLLVDGLRSPGPNTPFGVAESIDLLAALGVGPYVDVVRRHLGSPEPGARAAAVRALGADPASAPQIVKMLADTGEAYEVRLAALGVVRAGVPGAVDALTATLRDPRLDVDFRTRAATQLDKLVRVGGARLSGVERARIRSTLEALQPSELRQLGTSGTSALENIQRLDR